MRSARSSAFTRLTVFRTLAALAMSAALASWCLIDIVRAHDPRLDETIQVKPSGRTPEKSRPLSKQELANLVEKWKAFRGGTANRQKTAAARFQESQRAFVSNQKAKSDASNREVLRKIKSSR